MASHQIEVIYEGEIEAYGDLTTQEIEDAILEAIHFKVRGHHYSVGVSYVDVSKVD